MNQEQIENRINELEKLSNGRGRIIDGHVINDNYLEEYNNLKNRMEDLQKFNSKDNTDSIETQNQEAIETTNNIQNEENLIDSNIIKDNIDSIEIQKQETINKINTLKFSDDNIKNGYIEAINNAQSEEEIEIIMNAVKKSMIMPMKTVNIGGKTIEYRDRLEDESIEEYEEYLKTVYEPYGYVETPKHYPNTDILMPRAPYPHEFSDMHDTNSYYQQLLKYRNNQFNEYNNKYNEFLEESKKINPEYTGPVKEGEQLAIIPEKENEKEEEEEIKEVKGVRKAINFLKKHRKKIIIALGLTALVAAFVPGVIPGVMYANSVIWHSMPALQGVLHGANTILGKIIGANFVEASGLWTVGGNIINSTAANGSFLGALGIKLVEYAGVASIGGTIIETINSIKNKIKNRKNKKKNKKEGNEPQPDIKQITEENEKDLTKTKEITEPSNIMNKDILSQVEVLRNNIIETQQKLPLGHQNQALQDLQELNRVFDIINDGKNTPISDTVSFGDYRINPSQLEELCAILDKYNIKYEKTKKENSNEKEELEKLKESLIESPVVDENEMGGKSL